MPTWGYTSTPTGTSLNASRGSGGAWNEGAATLGDIYVYSSGSATIRPGVYHNPSTLDTLDADLIHDYGSGSVSAGFNQFTVTGNPSIPSGGYLILVAKCGGGGGDNWLREDSGAQGDFTIRFTLGNEAGDPSNTWDDPGLDYTFSTGNSMGIYIDYTAASIPKFTHHYRMMG